MREKPEIVVDFSIVGGGPERSNATGTEIAKCEWEGRTFEARHRHSSINELCRQLVAADVPDACLKIHHRGKHTSTMQSSHAAARWTYTEGDHLLRRSRYRPYPGAVPAAVDDPGG